MIMKKFVVSVVQLLILNAFLLLMYAGFRTVGNKRRFGNEVFAALSESNVCHTNVVNVILGDSVANQLFGRRFQAETTNFIYLASNQAITPIGNSVLLKRYLRKNPQTKNVYYMVRPPSLLNDGATQYTFHYMLYPFLETGAIDDVDDSELLHLKRRFSHSVFDSPSVRRFIYANDFVYCVYELWLKMREPPTSYDDVPAICTTALEKMYRMCKERNIRFSLIASPAPMDTRARNKKIINTIVGADRCEYLKDYEMSQFVTPDEWLSDHVHFKRDVLREKRDDVIRTIFNQIGVRWP